MVSFFFEVLIGGLLSGVMYSLVALGFVLIYKASGVFNFAQGSMVFFAALTFVGLIEHGLSFGVALAVTLAVMIVLGLADRAPRAASARQPAADLAVHGDDRPVVLHRRPGAAHVGRERARPRPRHPGRADQVDRPTRSGINVSKFDLVAAGIAAVLVAALGALLQPHAHRPRAARRRRRSPGGAGRRHSAAADLGASSGPSPASSRWSPACCGARATACSSR